ncbi:hypothetical protein T492DRAFT_584662 [Pavlovales sp. CCMP2436]|nr:hypothetical protein T492DRAFT_584662 [Pavlovales sp. CCMP2436]
MDGQEWESVLNPSSTQLGNTNSKVPASRDWVAEGAVSEVYNQANCGACWSFAAAGAIEGLFFTQTGELLPLSQQHLLACDYGPKAGRYRDNGCNGGLPDSAFGWVARNGGICSYADVPYISGNGRMYSCQRCTPVVMVSGFVDVTPRDELALMDAVAQQPVAVGIDASEYAFMFYKSGVLDTPKCGDVLDHAVLIVGYGTDAATGKPYWKVKNSWGPTWGEGGYVRMVRGKNMCGIADMPSYPIANMPMRALHRLSAAAVSDGITCNEPMDGDAKLTSYPAGSLLVFESGQWRTVCADTMGKSTAQLACYVRAFFLFLTVPQHAAGFWV